jgi:hypothetical protein
VFQDVKRGRRAGVSKPMNPPDAPAFESPADSPKPTRAQPAKDLDEVVTYQVMLYDVLKYS